VCISQIKIIQISKYFRFFLSTVHYMVWLSLKTISRYCPFFAVFLREIHGWFLVRRVASVRAETYCNVFSLSGMEEARVDIFILVFAYSSARVCVLYLCFFTFESIKVRCSDKWSVLVSELHWVKLCDDYYYF
jgi:hypothetical protein